MEFVIGMLLGCIIGSSAMCLGMKLKAMEEANEKREAGPKTDRRKGLSD